MNHTKLLSDLLVDGYKKGEFDRKLLAEKELLKSRSYDELLNTAAAMSVYINTAMPILSSNMPLMTQAYLNGIEKQKVILAKQGGIGKKAKYAPLKELAVKLVSEKSFKSRRNAAKTITSKIVAESERLGITLSKDQAEITITGWLKEMGLPANISL